MWFSPKRSKIEFMKSPRERCFVKLSLRTSVAVAMVFAVSLFVSAQTPAQVGDVYVGTCDGALQNTQQNEIDVYNSAGQFVTAFHGPSQNSCMMGMTFD